MHSFKMKKVNMTSGRSGKIQKGSEMKDNNKTT